MKEKGKKEAPPENLEKVESEAIKEEVVEDQKSLELEVPKVKQSIFQKEFSYIYLIILGVLLISVVTLWGVVSFGYMENPLTFFNQKTEVIKSAHTPSPSPKVSTPSGTPESEEAKEKLTIQILNGSGISGQAGELQDQLEKLGFQNIETGNSDERDNKITSIKFGKDIFSDDKKELIEELENTFAEVESEDQGDLEFDVIITTGSYK